MYKKYIYLVVKRHQDRTVGTLIVGEKQYTTLELPWLDNKSGISCIRDDEYIIVADYSNNKKRTVIELEPKHGRSQIQVHYAKELSWLEGCIGVQSRLIEHKILVSILTEGYTHLKKITI